MTGVWGCHVKLRSQAISAATLVLLLALPAHAQDGGSTVTFDDVGFTFDAELGASVNTTRVPGQSPDAESFEEPDARHLTFTLYGRRQEQASVPRVGNGLTVVRVYRTADLAPYDLASERIELLQSLLTERPDLGAFMEASKNGSFEELPFLPVPNAGQAIDARAQYIDTPEVSGIAYVTAFRQDLYPFGADDFWYTFQGISTDGDRFVAVTSILRADMFPKQVSPRDAQRIASRILAGYAI